MSIKVDSARSGLARVNVSRPSALDELIDIRATLPSAKANGSKPSVRTLRLFVLLSLFSGLSNLKQGHYTTALIHNPRDPTAYCNRAAAYLKLDKLGSASVACHPR